MRRKDRPARAAIEAVDLWAVRREWRYPSDSQLAELWHGMALVERERPAFELREVQRRRRWAAGILFGLLFGTEYCTALAMVPVARRAMLATAVAFSGRPGPCRN